ncbi:unnamed protein product [Bursaphelenchus xylophilus]|uniref:(pine wood nematode) hypothetical protein n=1 Tax=Bursaphelenchus xylophilus TaxID=6326 RepID=A0A811KF30_BURXY|nr:unnamed protein product [Bursaphelenchus xylophilus]CAG9093763.1 unnamed protein product [Bursaphelenchus xylophilus]
MARGGFGRQEVETIRGGEGVGGGIRLNWGVDGGWIAHGEVHGLGGRLVTVERVRSAGIFLGRSFGVGEGRWGRR